MCVYIYIYICIYSYPYIVIYIYIYTTNLPPGITAPRRSARGPALRATNISSSISISILILIIIIISIIAIIIIIITTILSIALWQNLQTSGNVTLLNVLSLRSRDQPNFSS